MFEQITKDNDVVNIATSENLNKKFWKYQNQKAFNRAIEESKEMTIQSIYELPHFEAHVKKHEKLWNKKRTKFNVLELEYIDRGYINK
jgi:hypothetical protein